MRKTLLGLVGGLVLLCALSSGAGARLFSISNTTFRAVFPTFEAAYATTFARCPVTLEGTFIERTLIKVLDTHIGSITRVTIGTCTERMIRFLTETLPWEMFYRVFSGALPNIASIRASIERFSFRVTEAFGMSCLFASEEREPLTATFLIGGEFIRGIQLSGQIVKPCTNFTGEVIASTTTEPTVLNSTARIRLRLI